MASAAAAAAANRLAGGAGEEQEEEQSAFLRDHRRSCYHVPQQSRREKLRFPTHSSLSIDSSSSRIGRSAPHGPFTGYAAVLGRSRFLQPALRLLEEVCQVGQQRRRAGSLGDALLGADMTERKEFSPVTGGEHRRRKTRLNCLLDEVHRRYKQYYHQMQAVVTSFEAVAGLSNAAPYASMALEAMTKHFSGLGSIISGQLRPTTDGLGNEGVNREPTASSSLLNRSCCFHGPPAAEAVATFAQPHFWRPQRGLPERAVAVLRAWLFEHFLHPYPTDVDKQNLAKQTGLTRNQVSNWFINARVRVWKPMVEEVHALEMREKSKMSGNGDRGQPPQIQTASSRSRTDQYPSTHIREPPLESADHCRNGVSLTLGLHRNVGIHFSDSLHGPEECSCCCLYEEMNK
ncbi:BEL1-like homeodomain protein 9 isoform X2 [Zingiber officinale]|uniref:BEL1-like homeodomain protein 9 isoform X2 n=1 Tax=Zingiber officinale TaxID=94328 RepID=UPI001C4AD262|nr:BEL1-like homeodomain protein 9 isoform X2 [Zingiber officinale]